MGVNVPSKSGKRIKRLFGIAPRLARSDTTGSSRYALHVSDIHVNIVQTSLSPLVDIMPAEMKAHLTHPFASFTFRHLQRLPDRIGHSFLVVRIHNQRPA